MRPARAGRPIGAAVRARRGQLAPDLRGARRRVAAARRRARGRRRGRRRPGGRAAAEVAGAADRPGRDLAARRRARSAVHRVRTGRRRPSRRAQRGAPRHHRPRQPPEGAAGHAGAVRGCRPGRGRSRLRGRDRGGRPVRGRRPRAGRPVRAALHIRYHRASQGRRGAGPRARRLPLLSAPRPRCPSRRRVLERRRSRVGLRSLFRRHRAAAGRPGAPLAHGAVLGRGPVRRARAPSRHQPRRRAHGVPHPPRRRRPRRLPGGASPAGDLERWGAARRGAARVVAARARRGDPRPLRPERARHARVLPAPSGGVSRAGRRLDGGVRAGHPRGRSRRRRRRSRHRHRRSARDRRPPVAGVLVSRLLRRSRAHRRAVHRRGEPLLPDR